MGAGGGPWETLDLISMARMNQKTVIIGEEPSTTYIGQLWYDTATSLVKVRNTTNTAWELVTGVTSHNLLSDVHTDVLPSNVVRGDIIVGVFVDSATKWKRLPIGTADKALITDGVDVAWGKVEWGSINLIQWTIEQIQAVLGTAWTLLQNALGSMVDFIGGILKTIYDAGTVAWEQITKTAQNILDTLGALSKAAITTLLTSWDWMISGVGALGNITWNFITKTAQNILDTLGAITSAQIKTLLASWANICNITSGLGNLAWSYITKTASDVMGTIASWANILTQVGALTVAQITTMLTSTANVISALGNWAWTQITKTAQNILDSLGAITSAQIKGLLTGWSTICDATYGLGNLVTTYLSGVIQSAQMALSSFTDSFWAGATGLAKFVTGFFTADEAGRGKFANLFVIEAMIDNLAVTNAKIGNLAVTDIKIDNLAVKEGKIDNLAVTNAKIGNLAVTEGKIDNLAVTEGKIGNLAVTNAKINDLNAGKINAGYISAARLDTAVAYITQAAMIADAVITNLQIANNTIEFHNLSPAASWGIYGANQKLIASFEALTGYDVAGQTGSASFAIRKNQLGLKTGTTSGSVAWLRGYSIIENSFNPEFKARIKLSTSNKDFLWTVALGVPFTMGNYSGVGFGSSLELTDTFKLYMWKPTWTINNYEANRLGAFNAADTESSISTTRGSNNVVRAQVYLRKPTSTNLKFSTAWTTMPTTKGAIYISHSAPAIGIAGNDAILLKIQISRDGGTTVNGMVDFITNPLKGCTIGTCNWDFYLMCYDNASNNTIKFFYGKTVSPYSYLRIMYPLMYAFINYSNTKFHMYPINVISTLPIIIGVKYKHSTNEIKFYLGNQLFFTDTYTGLNTPLQECSYRVKNLSATDFELIITNYNVQEDWQ